MQLHEVERKVADLDLKQGFDLIFDLLRAYGVSNASIARLSSGSYDKAEYENELLWKDKVFYRYVDNGDDLHVVIDQARRDEVIARHRPRFLIVRDDKQILAGIEKTQLESINYADAKAAEKMARLYDEI